MAAMKIVSMAITGALVFLPVVNPANASQTVNTSADFNSVLVADAEKPEITKINAGGKKVQLEGKNLDKITKITISDSKGNKLLEVEKKDFKKQGGKEIILEDKDSKVKPGEEVEIEYESLKENGEVLEDSETLETTESYERIEHLEKIESGAETENLETTENNMRLFDLK